MENCKICQKECKSIGNHLKKHNISGKEYFDRFYKKEDEGFCKNCKKETKYKDLVSGYRKYCSISCRNEDEEYWENCSATRDILYGKNRNKIVVKIKKTCLERYGVENVFQLEEVKEKSKQTMVERYQVDHNMKLQSTVDKIKKTSMKIFGVPCVLNLLKNKEKAKFNKRKIEEENGRWVPLNEKTDLELYRLEVWNITKTNLRKLYGDWDGLDFYTKEQVEINRKFINTGKYKSVDHKTSVLFGFKNNISPEIIGDLENLCICTRSNNSIKRERNEKEFIELLKNRGII